MITDPADLDRLPFMTVIAEVEPIDDYREVFRRLRDGWVTPGDDHRFHWSDIELPVVVLLEGEDL